MPCSWLLHSQSRHECSIRYTVAPKFIIINWTMIYIYICFPFKNLWILFMCEIDLNFLYFLLSYIELIWLWLRTRSVYFVFSWFFVKSLQLVNFALHVLLISCLVCGSHLHFLAMTDFLRLSLPFSFYFLAESFICGTDGTF